MVEVPKINHEDGRLLGLVVKLVTFLQKEGNTLKTKLDKVLEPNTFAIDPRKFKRPLNIPYKKYKYVEMDSNNKRIIHHHVTCHYFCKKGHFISKCIFRRILVPKGVFQWLPECNNVFT